MDDDDAAAAASPLSGSPSPSPTSSPLPAASALPVADPVTVAAAPPGHLLTLALPIQKPQGPASAPAAAAAGGGGGREDAWSEGATSALIDAWGERFLALGRGSLRHPQWQEVADAVSSRDGYSKPPKSDVQCKNRIDTLKKKYKLEKGKSASSWPFFHRLDSLLAPTYKPNSGSSHNANPNPRLGSAPGNHPSLRAHFPQRSRTPLLPAAAAAAKRRPSPQPSVSSESSDGFPPEPPPAAPAPAANGKRRRVDDGDGDRAQGLRELSQAIRRLGEAYERVERTKLEQAAAMERQRMEFARELEAQRVQFFLKTQMELSQVKNRSSGAPTVVAGSGARRMTMVTDVGASSNHHGRYRVGETAPTHRHAAHTHYQYLQNNAAAAAAAAAAGNGGESDEEEEEEMSQ